MKIETSAPSPLVTVVVPSYNEAPHIVRSSLESIRHQSLADFECIVVDESTCPELADACRAICAEDSRFIYIHPPERIGLAKSLNLAIGIARGRLIARFDSDDICMPERLALQVSFLQANPQITVVGGAISIISTDGRVTAHRAYPLTSKKISKAMQLTNAIAHPTVVFRREAIALHGGYNPSYRYCEDLELWLRWINAGLLFANLPQALIKYRQDNTRRDTGNWRYNLRARIYNFSTQYFIRRIIGIFLVAAWVAVPGKLQVLIYKAIIFRLRGSTATEKKNES